MDKMSKKLPKTGIGDKIAQKYIQAQIQQVGMNFISYGQKTTLKKINSNKGKAVEVPLRKIPKTRLKRK